MCWPRERPATHAAAGAAARGVRGDWGILLRLDWEPLRERTLDHRSGQTRMPPQERRHEEVFGLGDSFAVGLGAVAGAALDHGSGQTRNLSSASEGEAAEFGVGGALRSVGAGAGRFPSAELGNVSHAENSGTMLPFVLRVVAGACVGRGSGQPRMPPRERQHEGLGGIGGFFCGWTGRAVAGADASCLTTRSDSPFIISRHAKLRGGGRGSPRLAWSMPPGVGVLEIRAWEPAGAGDSGYFPRGIVPGPRSATRKIPE